ncbi:MAG: hypothetical protein HQ559_09575 [Lentisphaerae bacterium]|nr:hypothetical protein [Lentisphaerota bacterium]
MEIREIPFAPMGGIYDEDDLRAVTDVVTQAVETDKVSFDTPAFIAHLKDTYKVGTAKHYPPVWSWDAFADHVSNPLATSPTHGASHYSETEWLWCSPDDPTALGMFKYLVDSERLQTRP